MVSLVSLIKEFSPQSASSNVLCQYVISLNFFKEIVVESWTSGRLLIKNTYQMVCQQWK